MVLMQVDEIRLCKVMEISWDESEIYLYINLGIDSFSEAINRDQVNFFHKWTNICT